MNNFLVKPRKMINGETGMDYGVYSFYSFKHMIKVFLIIQGPNRGDVLAKLNSKSIRLLKNTLKSDDLYADGVEFITETVHSFKSYKDALVFIKKVKDREVDGITEFYRFEKAFFNDKDNTLTLSNILSVD